MMKQEGSKMGILGSTIYNFTSNLCGSFQEQWGRSWSQLGSNLPGGDSFKGIYDKVCGTLFQSDALALIHWESLRNGSHPLKNGPEAKAFLGSTLTTSTSTTLGVLWGLGVVMPVPVWAFVFTAASASSAYSIYQNYQNGPSKALTASMAGMLMLSAVDLTWLLGLSVNPAVWGLGMTGSALAGVGGMKYGGDAWGLWARLKMEKMDGGMDPLHTIGNGKSPDAIIHSIDTWKKKIDEFNEKYREHIECIQRVQDCIEDLKKFQEYESDKNKLESPDLEERNLVEQHIEYIRKLKENISHLVKKQNTYNKDLRQLKRFLAQRKISFQELQEQPEFQGEDMSRVNQAFKNTEEYALTADYLLKEPDQNIQALKKDIQGISFSNQDLQGQMESLKSQLSEADLELKDARGVTSSDDGNIHGSEAEKTDDIQLEPLKIQLQKLKDVLKEVDVQLKQKLQLIQGNDGKLHSEVVNNSWEGSDNSSQRIHVEEAELKPLTEDANKITVQIRLVQEFKECMNQLNVSMVENIVNNVKNEVLIIKSAVNVSASLSRSGVDTLNLSKNIAKLEAQIKLMENLFEKAEKLETLGSLAPPLCIVSFKESLQRVQGSLQKILGIAQQHSTQPQQRSPGKGRQGQIKSFNRIYSIQFRDDDVSFQKGEARRLQRSLQRSNSAGSIPWINETSSSQTDNMPREPHPKKRRASYHIGFQTTGENRSFESITMLANVLKDVIRKLKDEEGQYGNLKDEYNMLKEKSDEAFVQLDEFQRQYNDFKELIQKFQEGEETLRLDQKSAQREKIRLTEMQKSLDTRQKELQDWDNRLCDLDKELDKRKKICEGLKDTYKRRIPAENYKLETKRIELEGELKKIRKEKKELDIKSKNVADKVFIAEQLINWLREKGWNVTSIGDVQAYVDDLECQLYEKKKEIDKQKEIFSQRNSEWEHEFKSMQHQIETLEEAHQNLDNNQNSDNKLNATQAINQETDIDIANWFNKEVKAGMMSVFQGKFDNFNGLEDQLGIIFTDLESKLYKYLWKQAQQSKQYSTQTFKVTTYLLYDWLDMVNKNDEVTAKIGQLLAQFNGLQDQISLSDIPSSQSSLLYVE